MSNKTLTINEMIVKAKDFYNNVINIELKNEHTIIAVQSLVMPSYKEEFNKINDIHINDHRGLATLGDAVFSTYILQSTFTSKSTTKELTEEIKNKICSNAVMNIFGKKFENYLFWSNNDLNESNKKSYATVFEAIIGFIFYIGEHKACLNFLKLHVPKNKIKEILAEI